MKPAEVEARVLALEALDLHGLREAWRELFGAPPKLRSPELLGLVLAWRLQREAMGGFEMQTRRSLRRPAGEAARPTAAAGVRLAREWQGVRHEVSVTGEGGFLYGGERYSSLSQIARMITGTRWNGPRFFGLRDEAAGR